MTELTLRSFCNASKIIRSIDRIELYDAGLKLDDGQWRRFQEDPIRYLWACSDPAAEIVWQVVEARSGR